jgi:hypothetical protein
MQKQTQETDATANVIVGGRSTVVVVVTDGDGRVW